MVGIWQARGGDGVSLESGQSTLILRSLECEGLQLLRDDLNSLHNLDLDFFVRHLDGFDTKLEDLLLT